MNERDGSKLGSLSVCSEDTLEMEVISQLISPIRSLGGRVEAAIRSFRLSSGFHYSNGFYKQNIQPIKRDVDYI